MLNGCVGLVIHPGAASALSSFLCFIAFAQFGERHDGHDMRRWGAGRGGAGRTRPHHHHTRATWGSFEVYASRFCLCMPSLARLRAQAQFLMF